MTTWDTNKERTGNSDDRLTHKVRILYKITNSKSVITKDTRIIIKHIADHHPSIYQKTSLSSTSHWHAHKIAIRS